MNVTETLNDGLKREFRIVIEAATLDERLATRLETIKGRIQLKGFRPGKVPVSYLRKTYGKSLMGEIVEEAVSESTQKALSERSLRPAGQPKIEIESKVETVIDGGTDLAFKMAVELVPDFEIADPASLAIERPVAAVEESDIDAALTRLGEDSRTYAAKAEGAGAETGDALNIDFVGTIDGVPFEGGKGEDVRLVLGKGQFIPGFEEGLAGAKPGEERTLDVRFPDSYPVETLKGKDAQFKVTVHEVRAPQPIQLDDAFAERFGVANLDKLKEAVRTQLESEFKGRSRDHAKRALLDRLDERHDFALPEGLVEAEFDQIWKEVQHAFEHGHPAPDDVGKPEEQLKDEYRKICVRRVRLGLILAEIARRNQISVAQEELNRAIGEEARRYPGQEQRIFQYYRDNPQALMTLRAPLLEDKVVDWVLERAKVTDKPVSKADLMRDPQVSDHDHDRDHEHGHDHDDRGHDHDHDHHDHDHDHGHEAAAAKPKKARAKPAADKKPAAKSAGKKPVKKAKDKE